MSQKATACTIALFCRGIAPKFLPQPYVFQFNKLLTVVVKMKHYSVALYLFDKMRQLGAPVNEITMSIAVNCYCLLNRVDFGFAILGTFFKRWEPDATTFNTLIKGLFLVGEIAEAEKLFKKLLSEKLCEPDEIMYLIVLNVIDGLCKDKMTDDALYLLSRMIERGISPNIVTYNSMIQGLCIVGRWKNVKDLFNEMLDGYCLRGQMGKAKRVLNTIADSGLKPSIISYGSLINGYCKQGRVDEAWHLFMEISCKGLQHDTVNYNTMIHGLFCKGRFADGWKLFNDMQARSVMPDLQTYTILLDGLCRTQQIAQAFSFLCMMEDTGLILI
ncbi:UNVERIFIED_CONTAM: putative pentatricopeptide repeat-containing protein, mitochondrial [Sesamum calycinum]|uniref:Pentatricopeptide repeat-containing protein, mitochondrial n=1 Tax=Sesamum calycinum TaxID=2727403 RepID=A0AAW2JG94_9LAMI